MKQNILYKKIDYLGLIVLIFLLLLLTSFRASYPQFKEPLNLVLAWAIYLSLVFFCFGNLIVIKPWKEYLWSLLFSLGLIIHILTQGKINTPLLFSLGGLGALIICIPDYLSKNYKGKLPKKYF